MVSSPAITVLAVGTASAPPDTASVRLGVQTIDADISVALATNNDKVAAVRAALAQLGIEESKVETTNFNFHPIYGPPTGMREGPDGPPTEIASFRVIHSLRIATKDVNQASEAIKAAIAAGANEGGSIQLGLSDPGSLQEQATAHAFANANAQAAAIATQMGVQLGPAVAVAQTGAAVPGPFTAERVGLGGGGGGPPLAPGTTDVTVSLQVTYSYTR